MNESIFQFNAYVPYISSRITAVPERGQVSLIAAAIQCQRSHLSRVMSGQLQLTMDQAFRLSRFLGHEQDEEDYFLKLVEWERSGDVLYRKKLETDLAKMKQAQEDISTRLNQASIGASEKESVYYASWHWSALHILTSIPSYQTAAKIAERLSLPLSFVQTSLSRLAEFGLVTHSRGRWEISTGSIHLPKTSVMNSVQHTNWRMRAILDSQDLNSRSVHYTVVQGLSRADFEIIKQKLLRFIDEYRNIAAKSDQEDLYSFQCDLFRA